MIRSERRRGQAQGAIQIPGLRLRRQKAKDPAVLRTLDMVALVADEQAGMTQRQFPAHLRGKDVPRGVEDIDHHPSAGAVPFSAAEDAGKLIFSRGGMAQR